MHTNPTEIGVRAMHELKLTTDQMMILWQLTEQAKPNNGSSADLLVSLRNRLRPVMTKIRKDAESKEANGNGNRIKELVSHGRSP